MQHLWPVATWEIETHEDDNTSLKKIGAPVAEHFLDINGKPKRSGEFLEVPLSSDLYLLTAWYVHDFLDILNVSYTDPAGEMLWSSRPASPNKGFISTRALHVIPISHLWYTADGVYRFSFHFSNDDGDRSEAGAFRIVLNRK